MGERLKSAVELAMERFAAKGESTTALTEQQKEQIAEIRNRTAAKLAEMEILHKADLERLSGAPPAEAAEKRLKLQEGYVQERQRLERERDAKIERLRGQAGKS